MPREKAHSGHAIAGEMSPPPSSASDHRPMHSGRPVRAASTSISLAALACAAALAGCATPPPPPPPAPAPVVVSLDEYMQRGAKAAADGSRDKAREEFRLAAKSYPASKEPWQKLAQDYFESSDYGNAIIASQEVLQRDPADNLAASVIAVSGLRVAATALQTLGAQNRIAGDARSEAETMARTLRNVLGEAVLVPTPAPPPHRPLRAARPARPPVAAPGPSPAPVAAPAPGGNPFDKLK